MKTLIKRISLFVTSVLMSFGMMIPLHAEDLIITFNGQDKGFDFGNGSEYTATDLFDNFKNVMPGDSLTQNISVVNNATDADYIDLYMRIKTHDQEGEPVNNADDETSVTMLDFLSHLNMTIYQDDRVIYQSTVDQPAQLTDNTYLLRVSKQQSATLRVEVNVPIELGNEYMDRVGAVDWIFTAEGKDRPQTPVTPDKPSRPETPSTPGKPNRPETPTTSNKKSPFTGDTSNLILYSGICFLAVGAICIVISEKKKRS